MPKGKLIIVSEECHTKLETLKSHPRETYGDVIDILVKEHEEHIKDKILAVEPSLIPPIMQSAVLSTN